MSRWIWARGLARSGGANHSCPGEAPMPGQSVMSFASDSSAVHVLCARLGDDPAPGACLPEFLAGVPDHRRAQGRRHSLTSILGLACAALAAGSKSLVAIAEWAAAAPEAALDCLQVRRDPCGGARVVPSETTIRRALSDADASVLDERLAAWMEAVTGTAAPSSPRTATARYLVEDKSADYIFPPSRTTQPRLFDAQDALPWQSIPVQHVTHRRAHRQDETRTIQVLPSPGALAARRPGIPDRAPRR